MFIITVISLMIGINTFFQMRRMDAEDSLPEDEITATLLLMTGCLLLIGAGVNFCYGEFHLAASRIPGTICLNVFGDITVLIGGIIFIRQNSYKTYLSCR